MEPRYISEFRHRPEPSVVDIKAWSRPGADGYSGPLWGRLTQHPKQRIGPSSASVGCTNVLTMVSMAGALDLAEFKPWLERWALCPDGSPIKSLNGRLLPVRHGGIKAMLKLSDSAEEQAGARLMTWWHGKGAAPVLACDDRALLMRRATATRTLAGLVAAGQDDDATRVLCDVAARLHRPRSQPLPALVALDVWFKDLLDASQDCSAILQCSRRTAMQLLASPQEITVLRGDLHHGNVLDFGHAGWLAIDPKGLRGERTFEFANLLCNPDATSALAPGRFERRLALLVDTAKLPPRRLLQWTLAWAGLSETWRLQDGLPGGHVLEIAHRAAALLGDPH